jgi:hypothetical protein
MSEDDPVVVIFRKWANGDVIALFPELPHNDQFCTSYMHIGQHGGASYSGVIDQTTPATPEEYASLKRELENDPYNYKLIVRRRYTQKRS